MKSKVESEPIPFYSFDQSNREVKKLLGAMHAVDLLPLNPERLRRWQVETETAYSNATWRTFNVGTGWIVDSSFDVPMPAQAAFNLGMIVSKSIGTWLAPTMGHVRFCMYELMDNDGVVHAFLLTFQLGDSTNDLAPRYEVPVVAWRKPTHDGDFGAVML